MKLHDPLNRIMYDALTIKLERLKADTIIVEDAIKTYEDFFLEESLEKPTGYSSDWTLERKVVSVVWQHMGITHKEIVKRIALWEGGDKRKWQTHIGATLTKLVRNETLKRDTNEKNDFVYSPKCLTVKWQN